MINYYNLTDALYYYSRNCDYNYIETPWTIDPKISEITKPVELRDQLFLDTGKVLVASAEQSFIQMIADGSIKHHGRYSSITPCFRDERNVDHLHQHYFMKVELIQIGDSFINLEEMMDKVLHFMNKQMPVTIMQTNENEFDIVDVKNQIELGSYGIRYNESLDIKWAYGTGLAEPRFSKVLKMQ